MKPWIAFLGIASLAVSMTTPAQAPTNLSGTWDAAAATIARAPAASSRVSRIYSAARRGGSTCLTDH